MSLNPPPISIIGGDMRQAYLARLLLEQGYSVTCFQVPALPDASSFHISDSLEDAMESAQWIIGGIPFTKGDNVFISSTSDKQSPVSLTDFLAHLKKHHILVGGLLPPSVTACCQERNIPCFDFMQDDSFAIYNAVATAEGSIAKAILHHPSNLQGSCCLVLGYGRCAQILSEKLNALQAKVCVCARKETDRAFAQARGMQTVSFSALAEHLPSFSYIFNTVPDMVLPKALLQNVQKGVLIIDIASSPGGVDYAAAKELDIQAHLCLGLPGKYAAEASANGMLQFLRKHLTTES